jgi:hypothetical protein
MNREEIAHLLLDTWKRLNTNRVFHCPNCRKCWMGNLLWKTQDGKYVCMDCTQSVEDVTEAPLGQAFIQTVLPGWEPSS